MQIEFIPRRLAPIGFVSVLLMFTFALPLGCGGGDAGDPSPAGEGDSPSADGAPVVAPPSADKVFEYALKDVSPIGDSTPNLDGGRVEIASPEGWRRGSKRSDWIIWFHEYPNPALLPQIRITAEDAPEGAPQEATVKGAREYAKWVEKWVREQIGDETLVEPVVPLVLGENAFGRFVRAGIYKSSPAHRQILVTTKAGRVYTIETIVFEGGLKESRKSVLDGYAVGGSLKTSEGGGVGGFDPPGESED